MTRGVTQGDQQPSLNVEEGKEATTDREGPPAAALGDALDAHGHRHRVALLHLPHQLHLAPVVRVRAHAPGEKNLATSEGFESVTIDGLERRAWPSLPVEDAHGQVQQ